MSSNSSSPAAFTDFADGWLMDEAPVASARERANEFIVDCDPTLG